MARNPHIRILFVVAAVLAFVVQALGAGSTALAAPCAHDASSSRPASAPSVPEKEAEKLPGARLTAVNLLGGSRPEDPGSVPRTGGAGFRYVAGTDATPTRPSAQHQQQPCIKTLQVFRC